MDADKQDTEPATKTEEQKPDEDKAGDKEETKVAGGKKVVKKAVKKGENELEKVFYFTKIT